jgi:hypothetical protein
MLVVGFYTLASLLLASGENYSATKVPPCIRFKKRLPASRTISALREV